MIDLHHIHDQIVGLGKVALVFWAVGALACWSIVHKFLKD